MQSCSHNIPSQKNPTTLKQISENQCRLSALLKQSSQSLSDFVFETLTVIIQIDPKGSPVLCLTWMVELDEAPVFSMEIGSFMLPRDFLEREMNTQFDFYGGTGLDVAKMMLYTRTGCTCTYAHCDGILLYHIASLGSSQTKSCTLTSPLPPVYLLQQGPVPALETQPPPGEAGPTAPSPS